MKSLALFDFDGTITTKDTLLDFTRFVKGNLEFLHGVTVLLPTLISFKLKQIPNWKAKESYLKHFFGGMSLSVFDEWCKRYAIEKLPLLLNEAALDKLSWHLLEGHDVCIISASPENWIKPWAQKLNVRVIATRLQIKEGKLTGLINGKNCYGIEKLNRLNEVIDTNEYQVIYSYGDSRGDKEMLEIASKKFYRKFN